MGTFGTDGVYLALGVDEKDLAILDTLDLRLLHLPVSNAQIG